MVRQAHQPTAIRDGKKHKKQFILDNEDKKDFDVIGGLSSLML